jgi:hypothetical protein
MSDGSLGLIGRRVLKTLDALTGLLFTGGAIQRAAMKAALIVGILVIGCGQRRPRLRIIFQRATRGILIGTSLAWMKSALQSTALHNLA